MDVFAKYFRRLVSGNASQIFPGTNIRNTENTGNYPILVKEIQKVLLDPCQAQKIAESIDGSDGDIFRDFDLITFIQHFSLDAVAEAVLAVAFRSCTRGDLRTRADDYIADLASPFLQSLSRVEESNKDLNTTVLALLIEKLAIAPPRDFGDNGKRALDWAVSQRYQDITSIMPQEIVSALQLLRLSDKDQTFIKRLQRDGPKTTATVEAAEDLLATIGLDKLNEREVANCLIFMTLSFHSRQYNAANFLSAIRARSRVKRLDWQQVIRGFDQGNLQISQEQFLHIYLLLKPLASEEKDFDVQALWGGKWTNPETHLSFLKAFLFCPAEQIDVASIPGFRAGFAIDLFDGADEQIIEEAKSALKSHLSSLDAVTAIFDLVIFSEATAIEPVSRDIINHFVHSYLAVFMLSALNIPEPWTAGQHNFMQKCFQAFLLKRIDAPFALEGVWRFKKEWLHRQLYESFVTDPMMTEVIFQRAQEFGWTDYLLSVSNALSLDIACILHRDHGFDIEHWVKTSAAERQPERFGETLTKFLQIKAEDELRVQRKEQSAPRSVSVAVKTVFALLTVLEDYVGDPGSLMPIQSFCMTTYPRLINYGEGFDEIIDQNGQNGNALPQEVEQRMQDVFGRMYRDELSFREVLELMRQYKTSQDAVEQDLFTCIVHGLFDEYHCYHEYPPEALMKNAVMFGGVINFKLISGIPLRVGLGLILQAVRDHQSNEPMYKFGIEAIEQLTGRLPEWVGFCGHLVQIPDLRGTPIYKTAEEILREQGHGFDDEKDVMGVNGIGNPLSLANGDIDELLSPDMSARRFRCLYFDPPLKGRFQVPEQAVQEKVLFVLNNVSTENLPTKLMDLQEVLKDEHYQWFANYLVEQRAKLEPNYQPLYMSLLEMIGDRILMAEVLHETYVASIKMLNAESTISSAAERAHLKNLGGWLGALTIAKDKPIKHKNIYFKDLLVEAFDTQRLVVVIPFTCKVLVQGTRSTVFKPPNPWLMDILALLMELYRFADLRLNLKFEIEVLCKDLDLDHDKIEPSVSIRARPSALDDDLTNASAVPDGLDMFEELCLGGINRGIRSERLSPATIMSSLPRLEDVLKYPPTSASMADQDLIKSIVLRAFDQAIQEIIAPVVERSITIASISTAQLIQKDFACEMDEERLKSAARQMVKSLAGSLALVTCKEPLRLSITNYIRRPTHVEVPEQLMAEGAILMCVNDNLDTACSFVEKAAEERSVVAVETFLEGDIEERRRHKATRPNDAFVSRNLNRWALFIPEPYRQVTGGLNDAQLAVYEDFARQARGVGTSHAQNASTDSTGRQLPDVLQEPFTMPNLSTPAEQPALPHHTPQTQQETRMQPPSMPPLSAPPHLNGFADHVPPQDKIQSLVAEIQKASRSSSVDHVKDLSKDSQIFFDTGQILHVLSTSARPNGEVLARFVAEKICNSLFSDFESQLEIELMAHLLAKICQLSDHVSRDVFRYMTAQEETHLSRISVTVALIDAGLLEFSRLDMVFTKLLLQKKLTALASLSDLMDHVLFNEEPIALRADFSSSLEIMNQWLKDDADLALAKEINAKLKASGVPEAVGVFLNDKSRAKKDQMEYIFSEWIGIYQNPGTTEKSYAAFLKDMHQKQVINNQEDSTLFFRVCIDVSVAAFDHEASRSHGSLNEAYLHTDALAKLVILLVKLQGESNGAVRMKKGGYLNSILSLMVLVQNHHQVMYGARFNQRVFYRLFSSMLCEYSTNGMQKSGEHHDMIFVFAETFLALQPAYMPGFIYGWLSLITHRIFMPALLNLPGEEGWDHYCQLMQTMLRFIGEQLKPARFSPVIQDMYKGILRMLLILHHDFPEFVAENHYRLCNAVPAHCTQLRNLILSAYPQSIQELPDPFTGRLKVDRLDEMKKPPIIAGDISSPLINVNLKVVVDNALRKASDLDQAVTQIHEVICNPKVADTGVLSSATNVDVAVLNALVLYIGQDALTAEPRKFQAASPHAALLYRLANAFQPEARYHFLNAIANQLRYPNSHTNYFCNAILHLFGVDHVDQLDSGLRQQIVRVILERLIIHRPHPWGLLITLLELDHNTAYRFWELPFIAAAPEVRAWFSHLGKSCH